MGSSEHHIRHLRISPWKLTEREVDVMDALCSHGSDKKIGLEIGMGAATVGSRLRDILQKMECSNRVIAACKWQRWRLTGLS